ncbi:alpha/beta fold hydrolase [Salinibacterium sp. ZJ70]|uniref:alpha/beta fold hydrolase n=1 Tax=Salinibacterium sp. ZJ70 TaxID=2708084 RepID=UPI00141D8092|nr:alpha/beta fold hydrolase [Salinibacterium sp. ZJ70]
MPAREYVRRFRGTRYVSVRQRHGRFTLAVTEIGARRAGQPAFVLVHGIGVSSRMFLPLTLRLAREGSVHLVDLPGYGFAPDPKTHVSLDDHVEVVAALVRDAGLDPVVLIGHSMGAQVVTAVGERYPDLVDRIVLIAPTIEPERRTASRAVVSLLRDSLREPFVVSWIAFTDYLFRCGLPYLIRQFPVLLDDALEDRIAQVSHPMLIVHGERDAVVSRAWCVELAERSGARFVEVPGPHSVMYSDPEVIVAEILALVAGAEERS